MTANEFKRLMAETDLNSVIDLRSAFEVERQGIGLLAGADIRYHSVPFMTGANRAEDDRLLHQCSSMGEFYLYVVRKREYGSQIVAALEVIAVPENHPLVFHCAVGKDRTGILAAVLLSVLGVADKDIIEDYTLSEPYMNELLEKLKNNSKDGEGIPPLPDFFWKAPRHP